MQNCKLELLKYILVYCVYLMIISEKNSLLSMSTTYIWICLLGIGLLLCSIGIDASPFSDNDNLPPNSDVQGTGTGNYGIVGYSNY